MKDKLEIKKMIEVLQETQNVEFAYLFGSRAKNKIRFASDLDIALYFDHEPPLLDIGALVVELEKVANCNIDLVSLNGLYERNPKLAYSVIDEGVLLFCSDERLLIEYKKKVFLSYLDFKPVIDLFTRKLNERISNNKFATVER